MVSAVDFHLPSSTSCDMGWFVQLHQSMVWACRLHLHTIKKIKRNWHPVAVHWPMNHLTVVCPRKPQKLGSILVLKA